MTLPPKGQAKVCLVTGATSGIGKVVARALAAQGAEVMLTGRNPLKVEEVTRQIQSQTRNEAVHSLLADFSDPQQVRGLAEAFKKQFSRLDVLVNNAGAYFNRRRPTPLGVEMTFLVNHLAPFLLTNLLLDTLKASAPARIVNVSSDAHRYGRMDFNDLGIRRFYFGMFAYARSKLANILFTYELERRLAGSGVTVNALHPGHVATDIYRTDFSFLGPVIKGFMSRVALTPEQGADNTLYLASSPDIEGVTGKYFVKRNPTPTSPHSYDPALARRLWVVSEQLTGAYLDRKPGE